MRWLAVFGELVVAALCGVAAVWSWRNGVRTSWYSPNGDMPGFDAIRYSGPWLSLAALAAAVGGLLLIDLLARARRTTAGH
ncbi:hypothetical protein [Nocardia sp. NPDC050406]|uniref:hypothetical protein n=1 Tax=Nocardia sp. NPDC050406 TaxID=3364318 RepID=UPI0037A2ED4F